MKVPATLRLRLNKRSMKYVLFDLTVAIFFIAAARKLMLEAAKLHAPASVHSSAPECEDDDTNSHLEEHMNTKQTIATSSRLLQQYDQFKIGDTVEVYDPSILESHAFFAEVAGILSYGDGSIKFEIKAEIASMGEGRDGHMIKEEIELSSMRAYKAYEFNAPVTCDFSGSQYGVKLVSECLILVEFVEHREYYHPITTYHVVVMLDGELNYCQLPLSRIRSSINGKSNSLTDELFKPGLSPPYKSSISGSDTKLRGVVEMYGDYDKFAEPAIVISYKDENPQFGYHIYRPITNTHSPGIDPSFIHPYTIYQEGTRAICNMGKELDTDMVPCTIISHSVKKTGFVEYQVSYQNKEMNLVIGSASYSRVQRLLIQ